MNKVHLSVALCGLFVALVSAQGGQDSNIFGQDDKSVDVPASSTFVVSDFLQFLQAAVTCFNKLRIPEERFAFYMSGVFPNCPETQCFVRCLATTLNLNCDEADADIDRHYLQLGMGQDYNCFRQRAEQCLAANTVPCNDVCGSAYKQELCFLEDYRKYLDSNHNSLIAAVHVKKAENNVVHYNMLSKL